MTTVLGFRSGKVTTDDVANVIAADLESELDEYQPTNQQLVDLFMKIESKMLHVAARYQRKGTSCQTA